MEETRNPIGRPSNYKREYADIARQLCNNGATNTDLAEHFEVSSVTIRNWGVRYPEFLAALNAGKTIADDRVERCLYEKATGYTYDAVKVFMPAGSNEPVYAPIREHVPPDNTAMIFWLKCRRPDVWRAKQEDDTTATLTIKVEGGLPTVEKPETNNA